MRRFIMLIISILLVVVAAPTRSSETIIYAPINVLSSNIDNLVEYNIKGFQSFHRNNVEGLELYDLGANDFGFTIKGEQVNDRDFHLNLKYWPEMPPDYGFYYGHVVECDGLMGRCLIIEDKLKIFLPNTDFMSTQEYWEWRGCQYRSENVVHGDIIMGYEIAPGVEIDAYCPDHKSYQHAQLLYSNEHGIMRISMYTAGSDPEKAGEIINLFLVNQKGFLAQD